MANSANPKFLSIAKPYANAAFEFARDHRDLVQWKTFLELAATTASRPEMMKLFNNPEISSEQLFDIFHDVLKTLTNDDRKNFLLLLAQHKRFNVLPEISVLFNDYYDALEKMSSARVITAIKVDEDFKQKLAAALAKRTQQEMTLQYDVDPSILGGAIIRIGDKVIDASVRDKLKRLLEFSLR